MAGFLAVNATRMGEERSLGITAEETTPTTPRPGTFPRSESQPTSIADESTPNTPTRNSFGGVTGQRPLPTSPFNGSHKRNSGSLAGKGLLTRENSQRSIHSVESQDVDMEESDDDEDGSDNDSVGGESGRPSKKKKGQRFFCTDFPPCTLSFTRSEHLARHIRKHTGERPFQCHCARRFSRLDNLRQHAQTVHVNEEIPGDSLAATGTRFQRQIRTDRVRPPVNRSRASTVGSQSGSHGRGHSRNLSSSSIGSAATNLSPRDDNRRRPPPLIMANDSPARARLTLDTFRSPPSSPGDQYRDYTNQTPSGMSTPTSATFSTGPGSPRYPSTMQSPISSMSRNSSLWDKGTHNRRLSVPSGANPFQSPHGNTYPPPYLSPLASSQASTFSPCGSIYGSPTSSVFSYTRRDSNATADAEWRRRTWHSSTYSSLNARPATSGLSYYQTPDSLQPAFAPQAAASQPTRLPGIESFDSMNMRPTSPPRRGPSPMQVDTPNRPPIFPGPVEQSTSGPDNRRGHAQWDMSLHHNLTRLGIASSTPPKEPVSQWPGPSADPTSNSYKHISAPQPLEHHRPPLIAYRPIGHHPQEQQQQPLQPRPQEAPPKWPETPRRNKRMGWYNGPLTSIKQSSTAEQPSPTQQTSTAQRPSPEGSSSSEGVPTPSTSSVGDINPAIMNSHGEIENTHSSVAAEDQHHNCRHTRAHGDVFPIRAAAETTTAAVGEVGSSRRDGGFGRLEALVAVATSEEQAASKAF
ncbi:MAG: hypothetical protein M1836_000011 [Candelina mexicana]|nr:MAG: hypothetical protein M1836_000011 [Candelina mexicana]